MQINIGCAMLTLFAADILGTSGDTILTWTSPMYPKLYSNDSLINPLESPITSNQDALLGSLVSIGAMIGPIPFCFIAEKMGRKTGLLCVAIPHIIAYLTMAFAKNIYLFYLGRILGGVSIGGSYALLPMYIAEISMDTSRGYNSVIFGIFCCFGDFLSYAIGPFLSIIWFNITLASIPLTFLIIFFFVGIETPYYLVAKNKILEAEKVLMLLRSDKNVVENELNDIKTLLENQEQGHLSDIIRNYSLRKALFICLFLTTLQQLCGINAIIFYLQPIFNATGSKIPSDISSLIVGFCMFLFSFVTPFAINRIGRKTLLFSSSIGMFLSLSLMGLFFYIHDSTNMDVETIFWLPLFSLISFIFMFMFGMAFIPWTISAELFPSNVKQISASAVSCTNAMTSFVVTKSFNNMNNKLGRAGSFWFFAGCCLFSSIYILLFVPETKGKSFQEIQDILKNK